MGCAAIDFSILPWRVIIWLLWKATAVVGLKMKVDGLIGSNGVFIVFMRVSRNQDGVPIEVFVSRFT